MASKAENISMKRPLEEYEKPAMGCKVIEQKAPCLHQGCTWCANNKYIFKKCRWEPKSSTCSGRISPPPFQPIQHGSVQGITTNENTRRKATLKAIFNRTKKPVLNFGGVVAQQIYKTLFPDPGDFTCFQNGAFLFEDEGHRLFNLLATGTLTGANSKPQDRMTLNISQLFPNEAHLTHLIMKLQANTENKDKLLKIWWKDCFEKNARFEANDCHTVIIKFWQPNTNQPNIKQLTADSYKASRDGLFGLTAQALQSFYNVLQYERLIKPKYIIHCKGRSSAEKPTGVVKFYSYTVEFISSSGPRATPIYEKTYTFVKFETMTCTTKEGKVQHATAMAKKGFKQYVRKKLSKDPPKIEEQQSLLSMQALTEADCYVKNKTDEICYRCEDMAPSPNQSGTKEYNMWKETFNPNEPADYKQWRVGQEYMVNQDQTDAIRKNIITYSHDLRINPKKTKPGMVRWKAGGRRRKRKTHRRKKKKTRKRRKRRRKTRRR